MKIQKSKMMKPGGRAALTPPYLKSLCCMIHVSIDKAVGNTLPNSYQSTIKSEQTSQIFCGRLVIFYQSSYFEL
jgi:hypothetical protein